MTVRDLVAALNSLPPEYQDSIVCYSNQGWEEIRRLILAPTLDNVDGYYSTTTFMNVVVLDSSSSNCVSDMAEANGWKVSLVIPKKDCCLLNSL